MTGGRVRRGREYLGDEPFLLTYGDGVSDVDIRQQVAFHRSHGKMVTVSAYNVGQRFGVLDIDDHGRITQFREKARGDGSLVNIGYMVCNPENINGKNLLSDGAYNSENVNRQGINAYAYALLSLDCAGVNIPSNARYDREYGEL